MERSGEVEHADAKLYEFDKIEWFDVCKKLKPGLTFEEYEQTWNAFQEDKECHTRQTSLN